MAPGQIRILASEETILYRDNNGFAVFWSRCRHAGCVLNFNQGANTLDCPCHGSRYHIDGTVLQGPAADPLLERAACRVGGTLTISKANFVKNARTQ